MSTRLLLCGVNQYQDFNNLKSVEGDIADLNAIFGEQFLLQNIKIILNEKATFDNLFTGMKDFFRNCNFSDTLILYWAGHGEIIIEDSEERGYLLAYDSINNKLSDNKIKMSFLANSIKKSPAKLVISIFDCCYSGAITRNNVTDSDTLYDDLQISGDGRIIITACGHDEKAYNTADNSNGLFSHYLIKTLFSCFQNEDDKQVEVLDLYSRIARQMKDDNCKQTPNIKADIQGSCYFSLQENNIDSTSRGISSLKANKTERDLIEELQYKFDNRIDWVNMDFYQDRIQEYEMKSLPAGKIKSFKQDELQPNRYFIDIQWHKWVDNSFIRPLYHLHYLEIDKNTIKELFKLKNNTTIHLKFKMHAERIIITDLTCKTKSSDFPVKGIKSRFGYEISVPKDKKIIGLKTIDNDNFLTISKDKMMEIWNIHTQSIIESRTIPVHEDAVIELVEFSSEKHLCIYTTEKNKEYTYIFKNFSFDLVDKIPEALEIKFLEKSNQYAFFQYDQMIIQNIDKLEERFTITPFKKWYNFLGFTKKFFVKSITEMSFIIYRDSLLQIYDTKSGILKGKYEFPGKIMDVISEDTVVLKTYRNKFVVYQLGSKTDEYLITDEKINENKKYIFQDGHFYSIFNYSYLDERPTEENIVISKFDNRETLFANSKIIDFSVQTQGEYIIALLKDNELLLWK